MKSGFPAATSARSYTIGPICYNVQQLRAVRFVVPVACGSGQLIQPTLTRSTLKRTQYHNLPCIRRRSGTHARLKPDSSAPL